MARSVRAVAFGSHAREEKPQGPRSRQEIGSGASWVLKDIWERAKPVVGVQSDFFTHRLRALQRMYEAPHRDAQTWGEWSRDIGKTPGLTNGIGRASIWDLFQSRNWICEDDTTTYAAQEEEAKPESADRMPYDERRGEEMDRLIHDPDFPAVFRRVLKVTYYYRLPEYQMPDVARVSPDNFLRFLEGALGALR